MGSVIANNANRSDGHWPSPGWRRELGGGADEFVVAEFAVSRATRRLWAVVTLITVRVNIIIRVGNAEVGHQCLDNNADTVLKSTHE
jgi:hypothetical protein